MAVSGCEIEQVRGWSTNKTQFTVTSDHLFSDIGSLLYINISAFDGDRVCTFLGEMLRLDPSGSIIVAW